MGCVKFWFVPRFLAGARLDGFQGHRHHRVILGMRAAELVTLNVEDLDLCDGTVRVIGKRRKERMVRLCKPALKAIQSYMNEVRIQSGPLFISKLSKADIFARCLAACEGSESIWMALDWGRPDLEQGGSCYVFDHFAEFPSSATLLAPCSGGRLLLHLQVQLD
jgi:integrase